MQRLRKFSRLRLRDQCLLLEAVFFTAVARAVLAVFPFRRIAPWLGTHMAVTAETPDHRHGEVVARIQRAIRTASNHTPWKVECLGQALAASVMLRLRRIDGTVYLGIAKEGQHDVIAHAWLRSGQTIVTGASGRDRLSVVATFGFSPASAPRR